MARPATPLVSPQWSSALPLLLGTALVLGFLSWARPVLIPVALAILVTFLLSPLVTWLTRRGVPRALAATMVTLTALAVTALVGWSVMRQVGALVESYPQYERNINAKIASLRWVGQGGTLERARNVARKVERQLERADVEETPEKADVRRARPVRVVEDPGPFRLAEFWSFSVPILAPLAAAALVVVLVFFMLLGREDLRDRFIALMGERQLAQTTHALDDAGSRISRFLMTQAAINAGFGVVVGLGLFLLGIPFAPLWGAMAFVLRYIPYLGPWLAALLPIAMALLVEREWSAALGVLALYAAAEGVTNLLLEPLLYGRGIGVSQPALLVAVAFWTWLWGPVGLVLASPLTVCLVVLGRHAPNLRFLDTLLGDKPALEPRQRFYQRLLARDYDEAAEVAETLGETRPLVEVYEQLLIPALGDMREDVRLGRIDDVGADAMTGGVREIADELARLKSVRIESDGREEVTRLEKQDKRDIREGREPRAAGTPEAPAIVARTRIFVIPSRDTVDEAAVAMLVATVDATSIDWEIAKRSQGSHELIAAITEVRPDLVCVISLPPGGFTHARALCVRLKGRFPKLAIAVGRWGKAEDESREREQFAAAGVERVDTTLFGTADLCTRLAESRALPAVSDTTA